MSGCTCTNDTVHVRVSDEGITTRDGRDTARLRCVDCGGKAGWIPVDALEAFGYGRDAVEESAAPGPTQIHLDVKARWVTPEYARDT